jgi:putative transposase
MAVPPRRMHLPGTYFVTSRTWESRQLFIKPQVCDIVIETLLHYRDQRNYLLHSFVLMPDHFHLLLTPGPDVALERAVQFVKGGSSRRVAEAFNFRLPVWQPGFTDHRIRDSQDYRIHLQYSEQNPVKKGLVERAEEYAWSSASGRFSMDQPPSGVETPEQKPAFRHG